MTDRASRQDIETALRSQGVLTEELVQWLADLDERVAALDAARREETEHDRR